MVSFPACAVAITAVSVSAAVAFNPFVVSVSKKIITEPSANVASSVPSANIACVGGNRFLLFLRYDYYSDRHKTYGLVR